MNRHFINQGNTLLDALDALNRLSGSAMTLIVTDDLGSMVGTLTDGDIRRAFLTGKQLGSPVDEAMFRGFKALRPADNPVSVIAECRRAGVKLLPRLDNDGRVTEIIDLLSVRSVLPLSAVIMAGGKGERLRPLTLDTPKPLLEVNGKAIIDYNVERLLEYGITDITVCCRYLAEKIIEHFRNDTYIKCVVEEKPSGTIGAVALADIDPERTVLVMNSDLLTDIPLDEMYIHHLDSRAEITVAAIPYTVSVPYAILATEGDCVKALEEKPAYSYYANAGIYILSPRARKLVNNEERLDATELIERAIDKNLKVTYFPFNGTWIDIGSPADYRHAREIVKFNAKTL